MRDDIREISIDLIDDPRVSMRSDVHDGDIEELAQSIKTYGLLEPLVLREVNGRYELIAGHRRLTACKLISKILVPAKIMTADDKTALILSLQENSHRLDVNPVDEAVFIQKMLNEIGCSVDELAGMMKRSATYVFARLDILDFPDYLIEAVGDQKISMTAAAILNKITDDNYKRMLVDVGMKDGVSALNADRWWQMWKMNLLPVIPTVENMQVITKGDEQSESYITCAKCRGPGLVRNMTTVWIHRECPPEDSSASV